MQKTFFIILTSLFFTQGFAQPGPISAKRPFSIHKDQGLDDPRAPAYLQGNGVGEVDLSPQGKDEFWNPTFPPQQPINPVIAPVPQPIVTPPVNPLPVSQPVVTPIPAPQPIVTPSENPTPVLQPIVTTPPAPQVNGTTQIETTPSIETTTQSTINGGAGSIENMCQQFAQILGGDLKFEHGVCVVERIRQLDDIKIGGKLTSSPLVTGALFSFEGFDQNGLALNLGETVLLADEADAFRRALNKQSGMTITSFQYHWIDSNPPVLYRIQWYYVGHPLDFAQRVATVWKSLKH